MSSLEECIKNGIPWVQLPDPIQASLNKDAAEYDARVLVYYLQNQLEYSGQLIKNVVRSEKAYYRQLVQYSSHQMMLFPYHLQRKIVPGLKTTPFDYYKNMVRRNMLSELSYDRIPNFTAADAYQILGIGRNEYIELLNVFRGKLCSPQSPLSEPPANILDELLPKAPLNFKNLQPWFIVRAGFISVEDVNAQTPEVQLILDKIIDNDRLSDTGQIGPGVRLLEIPLSTFQELYHLGLVYVEVPILETDCLSVPTLDGFIMNRVTGDSCETLLYKIFVSIDPQSCLRQLAVDLGVGLEFVIKAASLFVRLGFAHKAGDSANNNASKGNQGTVSLLSEPGITSPPQADVKKIAFIFDSSITAYLMLGNLSADLKKHSVTMFEVGKLTGASLSAFYKEISTLSASTEQDVGVYYEHAKCLGQTMRHLAIALTTSATDFRCLDLVRCGSLASLEPITRSRILSKNYRLLVSMAPLSYEESQVLSADWPLIVGPTVPELCSPWFRLFVAITVGNKGGLPALLLCRGTRVTKLPPLLTRYSRFLVTSWGHDPVLMDIYTLFSSINDLTVNYPVFVQAYDDRDKSLPLHQHFLPLPLTPDFIDRISQQVEWLKRLSQAVDLTSLIGYLSILLPDGKSAVDSEAPREENDALNEVFGGATLYQQNTAQFLENSVVDPRVVLTEADVDAIVQAQRPLKLLGVHMGIPLFNAALNDAVFEKMAGLGDGNAFSPDLLSEGMKARLSTANVDLHTRVVEFIKTAGGLYVENSFSMSPDEAGDKKTDVSILPLPTRSVCCVPGDQLEEWED